MNQEFKQSADRRRRRLVLMCASGGLIAPLRLFAQQRLFRIGWLSSSDRAVGSPFIDALRSGLRDLGYTEGRNLIIDEHWGDGSQEKAGQLLAAVLTSRPDVIVTQGATAFTVVHAKPPVPVVFGYSGDPVEAGFAASLSRPQGISTGMSFLSRELVGKRMELLKEVLPRLKRVALLANPQHPGETGELRASQNAAKKLGLAVQYFAARDSTQVDDALDAIVKSGCEAVDVFPDALTMRYADRIARFALKYRIPAISGWARFANAGNVMSYGPNLRVVYRRLATYVDKVLKGIKPGDIPIELPTTLELVVNLKTAKAIGMRIPQAVLARADALIE